MDPAPETRGSLMVRLRDRSDEHAWGEFLEIYRPLIYRLVRGRGIQHADAEELTQEALVAVASAIERWEPDPRRGSFRGWLFRITRNMMINFLTRSRAEHTGVGGSGFQRLLSEHAPQDSAEATVFGLEYRREVFAWAARRVRGEFHDSTWQAFWRTAVEGIQAKDAAAQLGLSTGAVYIARSRVMARLTQAVREFERRSVSGGDL